MIKNFFISLDIFLTNTLNLFLFFLIFFLFFFFSKKIKKKSKEKKIKKDFFNPTGIRTQDYNDEKVMS